MTLPVTRNSPQQNFTCFSCAHPSEKPFAKIFNGSIVYHMCGSECLETALIILGLIKGEQRGFTSPVNITIRSPINGFVNSDRSPIQRCDGMIKICPDDIDAEQIKKLGETPHGC